MEFKLALLGGGGHASDILGLIEDIERLSNQKIGPIVVADDFWERRDRFAGRNVELISGIENAFSEATHFIATVGYPASRKLITDKALAAGLKPYKPLTHPLVNVNPDRFKLGDGSVVLGMCSISPMVEIGEHCHVSYAVLIGHDTRLGRYATLLPGASVSGNVTVGESVLVGSGAVVLENLSLGEGAVIGAGAVVIKDVAAGVTVVGNPARPLSKKS